MSRSFKKKKNQCHVSLYDDYRNQTLNRDKKFEHSLHMVNYNIHKQTNLNRNLGVYLHIQQSKPWVSNHTQKKKKITFGFYFYILQSKEMNL